MEDKYEKKFKIIVVGNTNVGKTNIMSKYLKNQFNPELKNTIGVEFGSKTFNIEGYSIKAEIWDTAGQERYKAITRAYYKGANGAFIVYDITDNDSFDSLDNWESEVSSIANKKIVKIIIGNKSDLEDKRKVTKEQGKSKACSLQAAFLETSALSGDNIDRAFEIMMNEMYKKYNETLMAGKDDDDFFDEGKDININFSQKKNKNSKKCCS